MADKLQERWERWQMARHFTVGQRVWMQGEGVGIVEAIDLSPPATVDIRWLTPENKPSVLVSMIIHLERIIPVSDNVKPMPRSREWMQKSREFCAALESILKAETVDK